MDHTNLRVISITVSFSRSNSCFLPIDSIYSSGNEVSVSRLTQESKSVTFGRVACSNHRFFVVVFFFFFFFFFVISFCFTFSFFIL